MVSAAHTGCLCERGPAGLVPDITNHAAYWAGLGVFHTGVEVDGKEWTFGGHESSHTGIFDMVPKQIPNQPHIKFRESFLLGETTGDVRNIIDSMLSDWPGQGYHLLSRNCNHFSDAFLMRLLGFGLPPWINRLAYVGQYASCLVPGMFPPPAPDHSDTEKDKLLDPFEDEGQKLGANTTEWFSPPTAPTPREQPEEADLHMAARRAAAERAVERAERARQSQTAQT